MSESKRATLEEAERIAQDATLYADQLDGWGAFVLLATHGRDGLCSYKSTIHRDDLRRLLEEFIERTRHETTSEFVDATEVECWTCGARRVAVQIEGATRSAQFCATCAKGIHRI